MARIDTTIARDQEVFVGIDVSKRSYSVATCSGGRWCTGAQSRHGTSTCSPCGRACRDARSMRCMRRGSRGSVCTMRCVGMESMVG